LRKVVWRVSYAAYKPRQQSKNGMGWGVILSTVLNVDPGRAMAQAVPIQPAANVEWRDHPYENHATGGGPLPNRCRFRLCDFNVDGALNDGSAPQQHVLLYGVRNIPFSGCAWNGVPLGVHEQSQAGTGVYALNSSFTVQSHCEVTPQLGEECLTADTYRSRFSGLGQTIYASTFTLDKTFSVDQAIITGCPRGIRTEGIQDMAVPRCDIDVVDHLNPNVLVW